MRFSVTGTRVGHAEQWPWEAETVNAAALPVTGDIAQAAYSGSFAKLSENFAMFQSQYFEDRTRNEAAQNAEKRHSADVWCAVTSCRRSYFNDWLFRYKLIGYLRLG